MKVLRHWHRHVAAEKLEKHRTDDERHCLTINIQEMLIECLLLWLVGMLTISQPLIIEPCNKEVHSRVWRNIFVAFCS